MDKTRAVLETRLTALGVRLVGETRVPHEAGAVATALAELPDAAELVILFGASAMVDAQDVLPAGLVAAGGMVEALGMPVDPGNLLMVGALGGRPVLGAPGCARSPKENGFDWVLARYVAGMKVTQADIQAMGVGGLLMEIVTRPQPRAHARAEAEAAPSHGDGGIERMGAVLLCAGQSRRMGAQNKLLLLYKNKAIAQQALDGLAMSGVARIAIVLGHEAETVQAALDAPAQAHFVVNPDHVAGMAGSLVKGVAALTDNAGAPLEALFVAFGDMPLVGPEIYRPLAAALDPAAGILIAVPQQAGRLGQPVLFHQRLCPDLLRLEGDRGARALLERYPEAVRIVDLPGDETLRDVDTPALYDALP